MFPLIQNRCRVASEWATSSAVANEKTVKPLYLLFRQRPLRQSHRGPQSNLCISSIRNFRLYYLLSAFPARKLFRFLKRKFCCDPVHLAPLIGIKLSTRSVDLHHNFHRINDLTNLQQSWPLNCPLIHRDDDRRIWQRLPTWI